MPKRRGHGDGGLYYSESKKLWRAVVDLGTDPVTGKRLQKEVTSRSQKTARDKLRAMVDEIEQHGAPIDRRVTVASWSQTWLTDHKRPHVDPQTYSGYASAVNRWIVPTIGAKPVASLKPSDIIAVTKACRAAGRTSTTQRGVQRVLSMLLDQARKEGLCARNVAADVDLPKKAQRNRDALPLDDASAVVRLATEEDLGSMWWFKFMGGPRQSEILGAGLDSLDLNEEVYRVDWSLEQVPKEHGCGERPDVGGIWPCGKKQGAACPAGRWRIPDEFEMKHLSGRWCLTRPKSVIGRQVPLIPQLVDMIGEYLERHANEPNPHRLIWRKLDGMPYAPKEDAQGWRNLLHRAGILTAAELAPGASNITGHWARHTTVTLLASLGVDEQTIGEIVGHSSEEVTRIYRHVDLTDRRRAMKVLGDLVLGAPAIEA